MIPVAIFKSLFGISNFDIRHHDTHTVIVHKIQENIRLKEITTKTYAKFKGVACWCGCEWLMKTDYKGVIDGLKVSTWSFRCRKCKRAPLSGIVNKLFREAEKRNQEKVKTAKI